MKAALPRPLAIALLLLLATTFAGNHVAARVAFDNGVGVLAAILSRSGVTALFLIGLLLWQRSPVALPRRSRPWLLTIGLLISLQSLLLYLAIARIPVALGLLVFNLYPLLFVLFCWALGGPRPSRRAAVLMALILLGLALAMDVPSRLLALEQKQPLGTGALLALGAALVFSLTLWVTERRLHELNGPLRAASALIVVSAVVLLGNLSGASASLIPTGMDWPHNSAGWTGLALLTLLYGSAFSLFFVFVPRLDLARNAPALNMEPIATMGLGWLILGQALSVTQIVGGLTVVVAIVLLSRS